MSKGSARRRENTALVEANWDSIFGGSRVGLFGKGDKEVVMPLFRNEDGSLSAAEPKAGSDEQE